MLNEIMLGGQDENVSDDGSEDEEEANSDQKSNEDEVFGNSKKH